MNFTAYKLFNKPTALFVFALCFLGCISCHKKEDKAFQDGDLLFVGTEKSDLSAAINRVTQTKQKTNFSHIAIVQVEGNKVWVLHATTNGGSKKETLASFLANEKQDGATVMLYRLKAEYQNAVAEALLKANTMLGKPYNYSYILNDTSYYCSDFIQRAFEGDSIFELNPMTFKNPATNEYDEVWVDFYAKQNIPIPEGLLGCNPNGLAESDKITVIREIK